MSGKLTLIPTPIDEQSPLESIAFELLLKAATEEVEKSIFAIEDLKPGRRRWLRWGLPRSQVENFTLYNEHTRKECQLELIKSLKSGKNVYLMSDGGLPAFCDPGRELVELCHQNKIKVTSTPFPNSISLALALSGLPHDQFFFRGFLPVKSDERAQALEKLKELDQTMILMDTPYRLKKLLEEVAEKLPGRELFLALDLNGENELLLRGSASSIFNGLDRAKGEFILIISK